MWVTALVLLGVAILAVLAGVFGLVWFFKSAERINRVMRKIPVTRVRDAVPGKMARVIGKLKPAGGPLLRRVELDRSGSYYQGVLRVLKQRENWSDRSNLELYQKVVAGLPEVVKPVRRVLSARYRLAGVATPLIMEEVRYLP